MPTVSEARQQLEESVTAAAVAAAAAATTQQQHQHGAGGQVCGKNKVSSQDFVGLTCFRETCGCT